MTTLTERELLELVTPLEKRATKILSTYFKRVLKISLIEGLSGDTLSGLLYARGISVHGRDWDWEGLPEDVLLAVLVTFHVRRVLEDLHSNLAPQAAIDAVYLGIFGERIDAAHALTMANRLSERQRDAARKRWGSTSRYREERNSRWRHADGLLRTTHPEWSERKRHAHIARWARDKCRDQCASYENVTRVLRTGKPGV